ncbi:hypothetical protein BJ878DRAFT_543179 [Calycina marina]|uniref:Uncharacterized protein n=1 Tax=Calycina marina TaxID=1763456 RepID=A0A9P8CDY6_9HELO|nr:hypothetical protein BJ878DRAFT_543179 [Calycina marina]
MVSFKIPVVVVALAVSTLAKPIHLFGGPQASQVTTRGDNSGNHDNPGNGTDISHSLASGTNTGTIFQFGDPAATRQILWTGGSCGLSTYSETRVDPKLPLVAFPEIKIVVKEYGA